MLSVVCRSNMTQSQPEVTRCAHVPVCVEAYVRLLVSLFKDLCHVNGESGGLSLASRHFFTHSRIVLFNLAAVSLLTTSVSCSNRVKLLNTRTPDDPTNIRPLTYGSRDKSFMQFLKPSWYVAQLLSGQQVPEGHADIYKNSRDFEASVKSCVALYPLRLASRTS